MSSSAEMHCYSVIRDRLLVAIAEDLEQAIDWVALGCTPGLWEIWFGDDLVWSGTPDVAAQLLILKLEDEPRDGEERTEPALSAMSAVS